MQCCVSPKGGGGLINCWSRGFGVCEVLGVDLPQTHQVPKGIYNVSLHGPFYFMQIQKY